VLLSHPQDFTPVCSTEIMELAYLQDEFDKLGVKIVVVSTDPVDTHVQWKKAMENLNLNNRGNVKIKFPLVDDENIAISKQYGMIQSATNSTRDVRGVFVIDPDNIIQAVSFYPMKVGRSTDELIRLVSALETTYSGKVSTPVNWKAGNDLLVPIPPKTDSKNTTDVPDGYYSPTWFLWYKKANQK
jgi:peroxiredoxin (alkyl hydroperoxide reductase subunit C)